MKILSTLALLLACELGMLLFLDQDMLVSPRVWRVSSVNAEKVKWKFIGNQDVSDPSCLRFIPNSQVIQLSVQEVSVTVVHVIAI